MIATTEGSSGCPSMTAFRPYSEALKTPEVSAQREHMGGTTDENVKPADPIVTDLITVCQRV